MLHWRVHALTALTVALCSIALKVAFRFVILDICLPVATDVHVGIVADIYGTQACIYRYTYVLCAICWTVYLEMCAT